MTLNETHDASLKSWVESANGPDNDFPIQNLPFGSFRRKGSAEAFRIGVAIGTQVLDLAAANKAGLFSGDAASAASLASQPTLNALMAAGPAASSALRLALSRLLRSGSDGEARARACLIAMSEVEMGLPASIGDYTDFFSSIHHARNTGRMFRPELPDPLLPNFRHVPIAYHGRASSIRVGTADAPQRFPRPLGQTKAPDAAVPSFGPSKRMDYELEVGIFVGRGNTLGTRVRVEDAEAHIFGLCLLNDWSARDIQGWEYQPLGPFLGKNFASTISPWVVTLEALAPFRVPFVREEGAPQPLPYLDAPENRTQGSVNLQLEVWLQTEAMRAAGHAAQRISSSNFRDSFYTMAQYVAHHTSGGCNLSAGDLIGSGTQSGPTKAEFGSILELSWGGKERIALPGGESRAFLEDGDTIVFKAACQREGAARIGFGTCAGTVLPAIPE